MFSWAILWCKIRKKSFKEDTHRAQIFREKSGDNFVRFRAFFFLLLRATKIILYFNLKKKSLWHCFRNLLSFLSKTSTLISREKLSNCFGWKTRENVVVLDFLALDNFDFTRKIVDFLGWKTQENFLFVKLNCWTKVWLLE